MEFLFTLGWSAVASLFPLDRASNDRERFCDYVDRLGGIISEDTCPVESVLLASDLTEFLQST